jgi:hypothetical protein
LRLCSSSASSPMSSSSPSPPTCGSDPAGRGSRPEVQSTGKQENQHDKSPL